MGSWVGCECEVVLLSGLAHGIANHARLDRGCPPGGIQRYDAVKIFGEINDDADVAALPAKAGATATPQNGDTALLAGLHGRHDVVDGARNDDAHRHLPINGQVSGIEGATASVEPDLPSDGLL